jgi:hypothetical protein
VRIFGHRREDTTRRWRVQRNEGLHNCNLHQTELDEQMKEDEMSRAYSTDDEMNYAYRDVAGKPESKRPLGRSERRREDNVQT